MADFPITRTRIIAPRKRPDYLQRPRLNSILESFMDKKLILVAAPAGYGKTALLVDFAESQSFPIAWYTIDVLDHDPVRFISYLIAAIHRIFPSFGQESLEALRSSVQSELDLNYLITVMVNDIFDHITEHFAVILDDYHLVNEDASINQFMSGFIQDVDENCHIIISSRTLLSTPDLPLLVARSEVGGLSYEELVFNQEEIQKLFQNTYDYDLLPEQAVLLGEKTEGWITGILLSSVARDTLELFQTASKPITGLGLTEYFDQLLSHNSLDIQKFMLSSSLLKEFDAELCEKVIGEALDLKDVSWGGLLNQTLKNNLFVLPVGEDGRTLRYHHLFQDYLYSSMTKRFSDESHQILICFSRHLERQREWEQAYKIYHDFQDLPELVALIEKAGPDLTVTGRTELLGSWLMGLPEEVRSSYPALVSLQGNVAVQRGDIKHGLALYDQAVSSFTLPSDKEAYLRTLSRRATAYRLMGNYQKAIQDAERIQEQSQGNLKLRSLLADASRTMGICYYQEGKFSDALFALEQANELYKSIADTYNEAVVKSEIGILYQAIGNPDKAAQFYKESLDYWSKKKVASWQATLMNNLGVLQHDQKKYEESVITLDKALQYTQISSHQRMEAYILASLGDVFLDLDAIVEANDIYKKAIEIARRIEEGYLVQYLNSALTKMNILTGQYQAAEDMLQMAEIEAEKSENESDIWQVLMDKALLNLHKDLNREAIAILLKLKSDAQPADSNLKIVQVIYSLMVAYCRQNQPDLMTEAARELESIDTFTGLIWMLNQFPIKEKSRELIYQKMPGLQRLFEENDQFISKLPELRKRVRQKNLQVTFAPAHYRIRALGRMSVKINNQMISNADWQTQHARDVFFILLSHPEGMTKEAIGLLLWPDVSSEEMRFRFKNTIYRLRRAVGKNAVLLQDDYYFFNTDLDYEYDVDEFSRSLRLAARAETAEEKVGYYRYALKQYRGEYLPEVGEDWAVIEREQLRLQYLQAGASLCELLFDLKRYNEAMEACNQALRVDVTQEAIYRIMMKIYAAEGSKVKVVQLYEHLYAVLQRELGVSPSQQLKHLYDGIIKNL